MLLIIGTPCMSCLRYTCYLHVLLSLISRRGGRWWSWDPHTKIFKGNWGTQVRNVSFINSHHFKVFEEVPFDWGPFSYGQRRYLCCFVWICLRLSLRTADAFPVVDRKCVCCLQAIEGSATSRFVMYNLLNLLYS